MRRGGARGAAGASGRGRTIRIEYAAPSQCPDQASFLDEVRERTTRWHPETGPAPVRRFVIEVTPREGGMRGRLALTDIAGVSAVREVDGATCSDVVEALALMTALAIDPHASIAPIRKAPPPPPPAELPPPPPPAPPRPPPTHEAPPSPPPARWRFGSRRPRRGSRRRRARSRDWRERFRRRGLAARVALVSQPSRALPVRRGAARADERGDGSFLTPGSEGSALCPLSPRADVPRSRAMCGVRCGCARGDRHRHAGRGARRLGRGSMWAARRGWSGW